MPKVYCAGPLFNSKEQEEMHEISTQLEMHEYITFLPQRDGLELTKISEYFNKFNLSNDKINQLLAKAIFSLDIYHVLTSDALVLNMNGRVPDEGAMVEAGVAWSAGITVAIYKSDSRTAFNGSDNPMILGLSDFELISNIEDIPVKLNSYLTKRVEKISPPKYKKTLAIGEKITNIVSSGADLESIAINLLDILEDGGGHGKHRKLREKSIHSSTSHA